MSNHVYSNHRWLCDVCGIHELVSNLMPCYTSPLIQSCCGGKGMSIWNGTRGQWECSDCGSSLSNDPSYTSTKTNAETPKWIRTDTKVCTCGAEKTFGANTGHSSWCDKGR